MKTALFARKSSSVAEDWTACCSRGLEASVCESYSEAGESLVQWHCRDSQGGRSRRARISLDLKGGTLAIGRSPLLVLSPPTHLVAWGESSVD
ncbi:hypothetical protein Pan258_57250 [Symmachiella dynata]|nr:hypothetical protein Pan258_57250 [Symmachiella dynata]